MCFSAVRAKVCSIHKHDSHRSDLYLAVVGTVEELAASERSINLVREQMDTNLFGPINIIKAMLPVMRQKKAGHIIALTGISIFTNKNFKNGTLTVESITPWNPRTRHILCLRMGIGGILRCKAPHTKYRAINNLTCVLKTEPGVRSSALWHKDHDSPT